MDSFFGIEKEILAASTALFKVDSSGKGVSNF
jgi:hypothetical protein